jgi:transcriptional regulator with XRE-family HTH domain
MIKPQPANYLSHIRFMALKDTVIANLNTLMAERSDCSSQNALAKKSGVSQSHVGRILRGESTPTLEMIEALAKALRVTAPQLLTANLGRNPADATDHSPSESAARLTAVIDLLDATGRHQEVLQATELLLSKSLPLAEEAARGHPEMASMIEQFTRDPASLTPESFALLRRQMQRVADPSTDNNEQTRKKAGGSGA